MRHVAAAALAAVYLTVAATVVLAADTTVTLPWGDWLSAIRGQVAAIAESVAMVIVAFALKFVPPAIKAFLDEQRIKQVEQLLENAIGYGTNAASGAVKGKTLDLNVGVEVVAAALQYAIDNGPGWLVKWMGGTEGVRDKIIARLPLGENVRAADVVSAIDIQK